MVLSLSRTARIGLWSLLVCAASLFVMTPAIGTTPSPVLPAAVEPQDAELQAAVVEAEDRRLAELEPVTSITRLTSEGVTAPFRLGVDGSFTLVLTPRAEPYTVADLLRLAPQTFVSLPDGSYLLSEHLVVLSGATLRLGAPGGLTLRMASGYGGFVTILAVGGTLEIAGEPGAEVVVTSWDAAAAAADLTTLDGRSYLRVIEGRLDVSHARLSDLGFWSGRTGGLALTGTESPAVGDLSTDATVVPTSVPALADASASAGSIADLAVTRDAYGLFVSGVSGLTISDSAFSESAFDGVVLQRESTDIRVTATTASRNAGHGFTVARATTGVTISGSTARENGGSGFHVDGRPLSERPSASGASLRSYGDNTVEGSIASHNGRYGLELVGGNEVIARDNTVEGHDMGVMVSGPATAISVSGTTVIDSDEHGIALVDGVTASSVTGNTVDGAATGIYLRDSSAQVTGNTVEDASLHGVTVVGAAAGTEVTENVLSGTGGSVVDTSRSDGVSTGTNDTDAWSAPTDPDVWRKRLLQPMNLLWLGIAAVVILSARHRRRRYRVLHPYAHQLVHAGTPPVPVPVPAPRPTPSPVPSRGAASPAVPEVIDLTDGAAAVGSR